MRKQLIDKLAELALIQVICEPECDIRFEDEGFDRECRDCIRSELDKGNQWAWCAVTVRASYAGFHGEDHLGGCSYESYDDFVGGGYFDDMVNEALGLLADRIIEAQHAISELIAEAMHSNSRGDESNVADAMADIIGKQKAILDSL